MPTSTSIQLEAGAIATTYTAGEAIVQYKFVKLANDGDVEQTDSANEFIGVAQNEAAAGDPVTVVVFGPTRVVYGAATDFTSGEGPFFITADAQAECIAATAGSIQAGFAMPDAKTGIAYADQDEGVIFLCPQNADAA